jgi:hypothetical protein
MEKSFLVLFFKKEQLWFQSGTPERDGNKYNVWLRYEIHSRALRNRRSPIRASAPPRPS